MWYTVEDLCNCFVSVLLSVITNVGFDPFMISTMTLSVPDDDMYINHTSIISISKLNLVTLLY